MIAQLSPHVADLIAAGEVVERPASAAKELLENAIDAGASEITLELRHGGLTYLRVTDNGCGIPPEELPTAFLRHATSKLREAEDLGAIGTLGFRGEALAAISAVSRVSIQSRQAGGEGASLSLEGGAAGAVEPAGCPVGTSIVIRDLFFNTPARLRFMKKDSTEASAVAAVTQQLAISCPQTAFRFIKDGEEQFCTAGDGELKGAVYATLGREFALSLLPVDGTDGEVYCRGFVSQPLQGRGTRGMQLFFLNGRLVKSQLLTAALEEAYRNQLMKGKFPGCVLQLSLPLDQVDVNVHPAKTQVKFLRERQVFDTVYHSVLDALQKASQPQSRTVLPPRADFFQSMTAEDFRRRQAAPLRSAPQTAPAPAAAKLPSVQETKTVTLRDSSPALPYTASLAQPVRSERPAAPAPVRQEPPTAAERTAVEPSAAAEQMSLLPKAAPWRIIGEALRTYILCEAEDGTLWLIDKHAAHERLLYDKICRQKTAVMRQALLKPMALTLAPETGSLLLSAPELLEEAGFLCEDFGGSTLLVREIPADLGEGEVAATLEELAELLRSPRPDPEQRRDALRKTIACKAAVKAGMFSGEAELRALVEKVQNGTVTHCPHGRPVAVPLRRYELEKMFQRT